MGVSWPVVLQTASAVIAASSFVYGVGAWRRTVIGQKRIDLAVQTIVAFKEIEQAFREIRNPGSRGDEGSTRQPRPNETEADARLGQQAYVAVERIDKRSEKFVTLAALKNLHQAYFGDANLKPFDEVEAIRSEIFRSALRLENHWRRQGQHFRTDEEFQEHLRRMHAAEGIFWEGAQDPDPLNARIATLVMEAETFCRSIIEPTPNLRSLVKNWSKGFVAFVFS